MTGSNNKIVSNKSVYKKLINAFKKYPSVSFKKGQVIIRPNEKIKDIFLLKSGSIRIYSLSPFGEELTLHIFKPGSLIPMVFLLGKSPNRYHYETLTDSETIQIPAQDLINYIKKQPSILLDITSRLSSALQGLMIRLESQSFETAYQRIASIIAYFAKTRGQKLKKEILIPFAITHQDLSAWVNANRETVSRRIAILSQKGIVGYRKRMIVVKNYKRLIEESQNQSPV